MYTNYNSELCAISIVLLFLLLCTYFFTNICTNKGKMSDIEFYIAFFLLMFIFLYIYTFNASILNYHETFTEYNKTPLRLRVIDNIKTLYRTVKAHAIHKYDIYKPQINVSIYDYKFDINNKIKNILTYLKHGLEN